MYLIFKKVPAALKITVRFYGIAYDNTGIREWKPELDSSSNMENLLLLIGEKFPKLEDSLIEKGEIREYLSFSINNKDIMGLNGINTSLKEGDIVFVIPPI